LDLKMYTLFISEHGFCMKSGPHSKFIIWVRQSFAIPDFGSFKL
jgi:hypothetical protein